MIQFFDQTGKNPLPPGILVTVAAAGTPAVVVGTDVLKSGGYADIALNGSMQYIATFSGTEQAPDVTSSFFAAADAATTTQAIVAQYSSPVVSTAGYAQQIGALTPTGWFTQLDMSPGAPTYGMLLLFAASLGKLDAMAQIVQGALRLQSCTGAQLDSWARDFLGPWLPRLYQESDASYYGRVLAALSQVKCTRAAIQTAVTLYYRAIAPELAVASVSNLAFNEFGAYNTSGAYNQAFTAPTAEQVMPDIYVWDRQTRPDLADLYNVNPDNDDGSFVIQIGFKDARQQAWFVDHGYLDNTTFLSAGLDEVVPTETAPDARLAALINILTKALGTHPLYLVYQEA